MERYEGVRFETRVLDGRAPQAPGGEDLVRWCRTFCARGFSSAGDGAAGNLSIRQERGFLVTPTHLPFTGMGVEDLVHVVEVDVEAGTVAVYGRHEPTSESFMHDAIYQRRPDVNAVFHGHLSERLEAAERQGLPTTPREVGYGTPELARLAAEVAGEGDLFLLAQHGFVALGTTMEEAGERALSLLDLLQAPSEPDDR